MAQCYDMKASETSLKDFSKTVAEVEEINTVMDHFGKKVHATQLTKTLLEVVFHLKGKVEYVLGGGFAVSFHAKPRATMNLSFVVASESEANRVLLEAGFVAKTNEDVSDEPLSIQKYMKGPIEVEILKIKKKEFEKAVFNRKWDVNFQGFTLPILAPVDLVSLKKISNKAQDFIDVENILETNQLDTSLIWPNGRRR